MIAAIVLAAGASKRLGHSKQLVEIDGETLVHRAARRALEAGLSPVVVVTNSAATRAALRDLAVIPVDNPDSQTMGSSIARGLVAIPDARGVVIMTVDQPHITSEHLKALSADRHTMTATAYAGTHGVPAYFPCDVFEALKSLTEGAKALLADAHRITFEPAAIDLDTPADLEQLQDSSTRK